MTFGASVAVLLIVFVVIASIALLRSSFPRKSRKRRIAEPPELSDPPTVTHYGHG